MGVLEEEEGEGGGQQASCLVAKQALEFPLVLASNRKKSLGTRLHYWQSESSKRSHSQVVKIDMRYMQWLQSERLQVRYLHALYGSFFYLLYFFPLLSFCFPLLLLSLFSSLCHFVQCSSIFF